MCVSKLSPKTLDEICKEALEASKTKEEKEVRSYDIISRKIRHYIELNGYEGNS